MKQLPPWPLNAQLEVIFWVLKEPPPQPQPLRKPSAQIVGQGQILDDLVMSVIDPEETKVDTRSEIHPTLSESELTEF